MGCLMKGGRVYRVAGEQPGERRLSSLREILRELLKSHCRSVYPVSFHCCDTQANSQERLLRLSNSQESLLKLSRTPRRVACENEARLPVDACDLPGEMLEGTYLNSQERASDPSTRYTCVRYATIEKGSGGG